MFFNILKFTLISVLSFSFVSCADKSTDVSFDSAFIGSWVDFNQEISSLGDLNGLNIEADGSLSLYDSDNDRDLVFARFVESDLAATTAEGLNYFNGNNEALLVLNQPNGLKMSKPFQNGVTYKIIKYLIKMQILPNQKVTAQLIKAVYKASTGEQVTGTFDAPIKMGTFSRTNDKKIKIIKEKIRKRARESLVAHAQLVQSTWELSNVIETTEFESGSESRTISASDIPASESFTREYGSIVTIYNFKIIFFKTPQKLDINNGQFTTNYRFKHMHILSSYTDDQALAGNYISHVAIKNDNLSLTQTSEGCLQVENSNECAPYIHKMEYNYFKSPLK